MKEVGREKGCALNAANAAQRKLEMVVEKVKKVEGERGQQWATMIENEMVEEGLREWQGMVEEGLREWQGRLEKEVELVVSESEVEWAVWGLRWS